MSNPACFVCDKRLIDAPFDLSALTCGHVFHTICIDTWTPISNKCPVCKNYIDDEYPSVTPLLLNKEQSKKGENITNASLEQVLKNTKEIQRNIDSSNDSLQKLKMLHSYYKELRHFFTGDNPDYF